MLFGGKDGSEKSYAYVKVASIYHKKVLHEWKGGLKFPKSALRNSSMAPYR